MLIALGLVAVVVCAYLMVASAIEGAVGKPSAELYAIGVERARTALEIRDKAKAENRELTDDEKLKVDEFLADAETAKSLADSAKASEDRNMRLDAMAASLSAPQPRPSRAGATPPAKPNLLPDDTAVTSGVHDRTRDDLTCGFRSYDDYAAMVQRCSRMQGLGGVWAHRPEIVAAYGANTFNGEDGGFLVPPQYADGLFKRATSGSMFRAAVFSKMRVYSLIGNSIEVSALTDHDRSSTTYRHGGVIVYLVTEGSQITRSNMKVRKVGLKLNKLGAISFETNELIQDGGPNVGQMMMELHGDAMGEAWLEYALWGTGAGEPQGMLAAANTAVISTAKEDGQDADTIITENLLSMQDDLWTGSEANALWSSNRECRRQLRLLKIDIGTGGQLLPLFERGRAGESPDVLDGRQLYFSDHMKALGDLGDIGLFDPTQYAWAVKRQEGIQTAMSVHLRFDYDEVAYRSTWRADGRSLWETEQTPRNGASGQVESPFIKLAARA